MVETLACRVEGVVQKWISGAEGFYRDTLLQARAVDLRLPRM